VVAELDYNGITRGATLDGPEDRVEHEGAGSLPQPSPSSALPAKASWSKEIPIARFAAQQYTECAQIYNPIHTEPRVALAAGLPGIILHGSATQSMALSAVVDREFAGDARRVTRVCGQLRAMVLMDSCIEVECFGVEVQPVGKVVFYQVRNGDGQLAIANGVIVGAA
jgi:acyl dehydratase